jgi:hypothetical protein
MQTMKIKTLFTVISVLTCQVATASIPEFHFTATVQKDGAALEHLDMSVRAGYVRILDLPSGIRIELAAPSQDGEKAQTYVRLLQREGDAYRILHESQRIAPSSVKRSFFYAICGESVQFISPASGSQPECKR